jgi:ATP-dependent DNA helicase RecG
MSPDDFAGEFPGESRHVEFKQGVSADRIARAVAAFSNTEGGVLLVGVGPDGAVVGTSSDGEALTRLHQIVAAVHDSGRYELIPLDVGGRTVVALSVARRAQGFAQTADGQVVVREDAMNVALIGSDLAATSAVTL